MNDLLALTGRIETIRIEPLIQSATFQDLCRPFSELPGTVVLISGGNLDCARYHMLAALPWMTIRGKKRRLQITVDGNRLDLDSDPFDTLQELTAALRVKGGGLPEPVCAGLFGYLSYDLKDNLEKLPRTTVDDLHLPDLLLYAPSFVAVYDRVTGESRLCTVERILPDGAHLQSDTNCFMDILHQSPSPRRSFSGDPGSFRSNFIEAEYLETVQKIRAYIESGDVYQVNLSQRFAAPFDGDPFALFCDLFERNPAPFFSYVHGDDHVIVSTSPERFLKRTGSVVEARPIKGTRPRGKDEKEDQRLQKELQRSPKDDAELAMIVDLLRNDLGKVCRGGSVRVAEHKRIEAYHNVYHLVSRVEGTLEENRDSLDLLRAAFPGGSITGCPKIRAMEIIDELEPTRRHIYTGAIGYIGFHDTMDFSIAIRTATITGGTILFSVGGGIVYDSNPRDEYKETLQKGTTLLRIFMDREKPAGKAIRIWINGKIVPAEQAMVSVTDPSFQYGYGLFETIRAENGKPLFLAEHLDRFNDSWLHLFGTPPPDVTWEDIIAAILRENELLEKVASVKIMAGLGGDGYRPSSPTLVVTCRPYTHRLAEKDRTGLPGLRLLTYPYPRHSPLAAHKTLNHLYYILAGQWATARGADEALILNHDRTISETNSAGLMLISGREVVRPESPYALRSIMTEKVCQYLQERTYIIKNTPLTGESLFDADLILLANSLMGAVPVISLDDKATGKTSPLWVEMNDHLFQGGSWRKDLPIC
jgi:para-aminobenzoate synthetase component 1